LTTLRALALFEVSRPLTSTTARSD
jgi:hypothetical protein